MVVVHLNGIDYKGHMVARGEYGNHLCTFPFKAKEGGTQNPQDLPPTARLKAQKRRFRVTVVIHLTNTDLTLVLRTVPGTRGMLQIASSCPFSPTLQPSPVCSGPSSLTCMGSIRLQCSLVTGCANRAPWQEVEGGWSQFLLPLASSLWSPRISMIGYHCCSQGG